MQFNKLRTLKGPYRCVGAIGVPVGLGRAYFYVADVFKEPINHSRVYDENGKELFRHDAETICDPILLGPHVYAPMEHGAHRVVKKRKGQKVTLGADLKGRWAVASCFWKGGIITAVNNDFRVNSQFYDKPQFRSLGTGRRRATGMIPGFPHSMASIGDTLAYCNSFCGRDAFGVWTLRDRIIDGDHGVIEAVYDEWYTLPGGTSTMYGAQDVVFLGRYARDGTLKKRWRLEGKRGVDLLRAGDGLFIMTAQPFTAYMLDPLAEDRPIKIWQSMADYPHAHRSFGAYFAMDHFRRRLYIGHTVGSNTQIDVAKL